MSSEQTKKALPTLLLTALGIVYGDLGTSPLYAEQTIVTALGGKVDDAAALGIFSLVFWALLVTISLKYCILVMRADNHGEGGILALMALIGLNRGRRRAALVAAGLFGAALIYGDGIITPAISVLSALEGLTVVTKDVQPFVMPAAALILLGLFAFQTFGTAVIGKLFGPVMLVWFIVIGAIGAWNIVQHPRALAALNPWYGAHFLFTHGVPSVAVIGGVFLTITGGEAMYADMGHMGRRPIRIAWFAVVLPGLLLSYGGQTAMLLGDGAGDGNPFFRATPHWAILPLVGLATLATIIASQAIITGAFSLTRQAMQLGWFPGLSIRQTSDEEYGQIYVPVVNWVMMVLTLVLTVVFGSSDRLAGAYGTAVSTTMLLTTVLLFTAMREVWRWNRVGALAIAGFFLVVDVVFFSANLVKIAEGGWIPLVVGAVLFAVMTTWRRGVDVLREHLEERVSEPAAFFKSLVTGEIPRVPGTAVFLTRNSRPVPALIVQHVELFGALPRSVVSLTVKFEEVPRVAEAKRLEIEPLTEGLVHLTVHYGFVERPNLSAALAEAERRGCEIDLAHANYFGGRDDVEVRQEHGAMQGWRRMLFAALYRNSVHTVDRFELEGERFTEIGRRVEI